MQIKECIETSTNKDGKEKCHGCISNDMLTENMNNHDEQDEVVNDHWEEAYPAIAQDFGNMWDLDVETDPPGAADACSAALREEAEDEEETAAPNDEDDGPEIPSCELSNLKDISILFSSIHNDKRSTSLLAEEDACDIVDSQNVPTREPTAPEAQASISALPTAPLGQQSAKASSTPSDKNESILCPIRKLRANLSSCSPVLKAPRASESIILQSLKKSSPLQPASNEGIRKGRFVIKPAVLEKASGILTMQQRKGRFQVTEAPEEAATAPGISRKILHILSLQNKQIDILFDMLRNISGEDKLFQREFIQLSNDVYDLTEVLKKRTDLL